MVIDIYPLLLAHGANILDENNQPTINTPEFKAALEFYIELKNAGQIMEKDDIVASVSNGDAAMSLTWPGWYLPEADEPIKFAPAPNKVGDGDEEHTSTSIYGIWYLGVASNSQNKELAMEYIDYITSPEIMTESVKFGGVPTRHSSYQDEEVQEARPHLASVYEALQHAKFRPQLKEWPQITNAVGIELELIGAVVWRRRTAAWSGCRCGRGPGAPRRCRTDQRWGSAGSAGSCRRCRSDPAAAVDVLMDGDDTPGASGSEAMASAMACLCSATL